MKAEAVNICTSRKRCVLEKQQKDKLFFSLMDYRNNLFMSSDSKKIKEFYDGFETVDELIEWMKERPNGASYIHEVEGEKDIIVVIPTADFNGKYARECRENIFKGLHMIFVESGEVPDPYFNIARNVSIGIKKAMVYKPKWIVVSGDDMYKIDDVDVLVRQLRNINEEDYNVVFAKPSIYHTVPSKIIRINFLYNLFNLITNYDAGRIRVKLHRKFKIEFTSMKAKYATIFSFFQKGYYFLDPLDFLVYSYKFLEQVMGNVLDETFINGGEDEDVALRVSVEGGKFKIIDYRIGDYISMSFGRNNIRWIMNVANLCYFNFKWRDRLRNLTS